MLMAPVQQDDRFFEGTKTHQDSDECWSKAGVYTFPRDFRKVTGHWALWSTDDLGRGGDEEGRMQLPSPLQSHSSHSREWSSCLAPSSCEVSPWPQVWWEVKLPRSLERSQRVPPSKAGQDTKGTEKHEAVAWGVSLTSGFSELFSDDFVDNKMWVKPSCFLTTMSLYL